MLSSLEKSTDLQKATQSFIKAVKRVANKLPVNRAQIEGDLSLFVSSLWDKLESEITSDFTGESRLIESGGTSRVVQSDRQIKIKCSHCASHQIVKDGFTSSGKQRFLCRSCKRTSREDPDPSTHAVDKRQQVMRVYLIFKSYRKVAQVCGVDRRTVANWIKQNGVTILHPRPRKAIKRNNSSA
jgi:transposase-like protein